MDYPNSHTFSQGLELSQLTGGFSKEQVSNDNENQDYNMQENEICPGQSETLSSRAEAIFEENRQINRYVESSLKHLEKKRIKLLNKEIGIDDMKKKLMETHKRQSEQNLELQMNIEEWSSKYQNECMQRNRVVEKSKQIKEFTDLFEQQLVKGQAFGDDIEEMKNKLQTEFKTIQNTYKCICEKKDRMNLSVSAELKTKTQNCKNCREDIMKERESSIGVIQSLASQNDEMLQMICEVRQNIEETVRNKEAMTHKFKQIAVENKAMNESITKFYQDLNELKSVSASRIQHLKLQINTEENNNSNQEIKSKEKKHFLNSLTLKHTELLNLSNQIEEAINGIQKNVVGKTKETEQYKEKQIVLTEEVCSLTETIKKHENVEKENELFKSKILSTEEDLKLNINVLEEKEKKVKELSYNMNKLNEIIHNLEESKSEFETKIKEARNCESQLITKVREDKIHNEQEREKKLLQNDKYKESNAELSSEIDKTTLELNKLCSVNDCAKEREGEMNVLIKSLNKNVIINNENLLKLEEEQMELQRDFEDQIGLKKDNLNKLEYYYIMEAEPQQKELRAMISKRESLEQDIKLLMEEIEKKIKTLENIQTDKVQAMDQEMEKYTSIMKNIVATEEEQTNKLREDIKEQEKIKSKFDDVLQALHQKLKILKNEEMTKRNKIAKMEKRQQTIMKEIKVTREDIVHAVGGNIQEGNPGVIKKIKLMTPTSSVASSQSLHQKTNEKSDGTMYRPTSIPPKHIAKQEVVRKWAESVPDDEYEFSEI